MRKQANYNVIDPKKTKLTNHNTPKQTIQKLQNHNLKAKSNKTQTAKPTTQQITIPHNNTHQNQLNVS